MNKHILIIDNFLYINKKYSLTPSILLKDHLEKEGIKVNFSSTRVNRIRRLIDMLVSIFVYQKACDMVLICVFSGKAFLWAYLSSNLCYLIKKPYILFMHGGNLPLLIEKKERKVMSICKRALCTVCPSGYLKNKLQDKGIDAVKVIPNFIDLENHTFKRRTEISPKLFWLRAYHDIYNPQMAIRLLHILKKDYPQATLTMAGPDKGRLRKVKLLAKNLGIYDSVYFFEFISKKEIDYLGFRHNIFINTTHVDNMPVTILEAMAMGLPIVSTNVGGIPYLLEDGKTALLVPDDDHIAMAEAVRKLLDGPELVKYLTSNSRAKVKQFIWQNVWPLWHDVFNLADNEAG